MKILGEDQKKSLVYNGIDMMDAGYFIYRAEGDEEILYANKALIELYECDGMEDFMELTKGSFMGMVYSEDLDRVEDSIKQQISTGKKIDKVIYRIKTKNKKIKYIEDFGALYTDPDEGLLFGVTIFPGTSELVKPDIDEKLKEKLQNESDDATITIKNHFTGLNVEDEVVLSSISASYNSIHVIDIEADRYKEIRATELLHNYVGSEGIVSEMFPKIMSTACAPDYIDDMMKFIDMSTLQDRLADTNFIDIDFLGVIKGWTKASFFVTKRNEHNRAVKVLFVTKTLDI